MARLKTREAERDALRLELAATAAPIIVVIPTRPSWRRSTASRSRAWRRC
jgi:hypothetical protein